MSGRVVVVGSYNLDHVWSTTSLPERGATRLGRYASGPGGKGFNQAVAAARAGASTRFVCALGADAAATQARALVGQHAIDLRAEIHPELPSGAAGIFVDQGGGNVIVVAPGANGALSIDHVHAQAEAFDAGTVLLVQLEVPSEAVARALTQARAAGATSILNPAPADAPTSRAMLAACSILTPNETEFVALLAHHAGGRLPAGDVERLDDDELHTLCRLLEVPTVVVTLGDAGCFVSHDSRTEARGDEELRYRIPAEPVQAIDSTGAGDAFNGALAAALATAPDRPFVEAVRFANRYAALSTEHAGAALAMPDLAAVRARFG